MIPPAPAGRGREASGRRIVIATLGSLGDLHPYLALARGLQKRGRRVVIATTPSYRTNVQSAGIEFAPLGPESPPIPPEIYACILDPKRGLEFVFRELFMPATRRTYQDLQAAVTSGGGADLLVSAPVVFAAPLLAEKTGLPWVSTVLAPIAFFSAYEPPALPGLPDFLTRGPGWLRPWWGRALRAMARRTTRPWSAPVDDLRRELALPASRAHPIYEGQHSPRLVLAMFSAVLGARQPDWPAQTRQTGFAFYDGQEGASSAIDPRLARFLDEGPPAVVFTLGSTAVNSAGEFYRVSMAAAERLGVRALLLVGKETGNRVGLRDPPPEGMAVFDYAPYSAVFPRAAAIVHQGGVGTTAQALRAGRPMLVVPFNFDQPDNAARVVRAGVGQVTPLARYKPAIVAAALGDLLKNEPLKQRARIAGQQLTAENGVETACDALERLL